MIRILHIIAAMNRGGAETFIMNVYRKINREKIQFDFLTNCDSGGAYDQEIHSLGGKIYNITSRRESILKNKNELVNFFEKHNEYKIVHQHSSSQSYNTPLLVAKKKGVPIRILHSHNSKIVGNSLHIYIHKINRIIYNDLSTDLFACSDIAGKWMFGNKTFSVINNGIETQKFAYNYKRRTKIRNALGINKEQILFGNIGSLTTQKNHKFLIDIFNDIKKIKPDSKLLIVGDGNLKPIIVEKSKKLGILKDIIFTGIVDNPEDYLQAMDAFIFPSLFEGLPVTLIEAQTSGLKCFISNNITDQAILTANVIKLPLEIGSKKWAETIIREISYERFDMMDIIKNKGFDIEQTSNYLEQFYIEKSTENDKR